LFDPGGGGKKDDPLNRNDRGKGGGWLITRVGKEEGSDASKVFFLIPFRTGGGGGKKTGEFRPTLKLLREGREHVYPIQAHRKRGGRERNTKKSSEKKEASIVFLLKTSTGKKREGEKGGEGGNLFSSLQKRGEGEEFFLFQEGKGGK